MSLRVASASARILNRFNTAAVHSDSRALQRHVHLTERQHQPYTEHVRFAQKDSAPAPDATHNAHKHPRPARFRKTALAAISGRLRSACSSTAECGSGDRSMLQRETAMCKLPPPATKNAGPAQRDGRYHRWDEPRRRAHAAGGRTQLAAASRVARASRSEA